MQWAIDININTNVRKQEEKKKETQAQVNPPVSNLPPVQLFQNAPSHCSQNILRP